jgi:membrane peptidoglycan carboxypeptidase
MAKSKKKKKNKPKKTTRKKNKRRRSPLKRKSVSVKIAGKKSRSKKEAAAKKERAQKRKTKPSGIKKIRNINTVREKAYEALGFLKNNLTSATNSLHKMVKSTKLKLPVPKKRKKPKERSREERLRNFLAKYKKVIGVPVFVGLFALLVWTFWGIPLPSKLASSQVPVSTKIYDRNDKLIYEIYTDKRSTPVNIDDIPDYVKEATIAVEDKDFYKHYGVSFTGIIRAAYNTVFKRKLQGGSTLTQQLVKNSLLTPERTIRRKIRELALTLAVETIYSKDRILEMYLNQIPYGGTAYGIGAASEIYFGKEARDLTLAEAALLAGLPAAPSRYSPFGSHPELAKGRQETTLRRMVEDGYISQEKADKAKLRPSCSCHRSWQT